MRPSEWNIYMHTLQRAHSTKGLVLWWQVYTGTTYKSEGCCPGRLCCMVWAVGCLRNFSSTLQWSCFPSLSIPIPSYTGPCQWLNLTQHCCGKCSITKLLNRKPLMLRISCNWIVLRHDLGFVLHKCPVLIQVLSTCLLCVNLFKSHSGTEHFDCEQINLRDCLVFVQCLGRWVSTLGINILENIFRFLAEGLLLFSLLPLPSHCWLQSDIFTVLIPRKDPLVACPGKKWGLVLLKPAWKNIMRGEAEFRPNINRVACPKISFWSKSCSAVESPKYQ